MPVTRAVGWARQNLERAVILTRDLVDTGRASIRQFCEDSPFNVFQVVVSVRDPAVVRPLDRAP